MLGQGYDVVRSMGRVKKDKFYGEKMKRSEMLLYLADVLLDNNMEGMTLEMQASRILKKLEKRGMLPPFSSAAARKSDMIESAGHEWEDE